MSLVAKAAAVRRELGLPDMTAADTVKAACELMGIVEKPGETLVSLLLRRQACEPNEDVRPPGRGGWLGVAARVRAGHSRNWDRVWRCVVSGKVAELDPLCTFVTDVLTWSGTHLDICCPECPAWRTSM